jgi:hypothetical protein
MKFDCHKPDRAANHFGYEKHEGPAADAAPKAPIGARKIHGGGKSHLGVFCG